MFQSEIMGYEIMSVDLITDLRKISFATFMASVSTPIPDGLEWAGPWEPFAVVETTIVCRRPYRRSRVEVIQ